MLLLLFFMLYCPSLSSCLKHFFWVSQALEQQLAALQAEMEQLRQKETPEELTSSATQLQELQAQ